MKILVVCSGNICRSPMAVAVLSDRLRRRGLLGAVEVASAGTLGIEGEPADPFAVKACAAAGYDISRHRSAAFNGDSAASSDLILVMEEQHVRAVRAAAPRAEVSLLGAFLPPSLRLEGAGEIADPVGGDLETFEECLSLIERAVDGLMASRPWPAKSASGGEEDDDPEVAYFRAVEEQVIEARKGGRGLTPMEFHVIDGWWKRRLPLWLVLEAAGEAALDWPRGEAPRGFIRRLEREVEARAREAGFEAPPGPQVALDSEDESRSRRTIARELRAAARKQARAHPALGEALESAAGAIGREGGPDLASEIRRCRKEICAAARRSLPLGAYPAIEQEERRRLGALSERLSPGAAEQTLQRLVESRILEYFRLPSLSSASLAED